MSQGAARSTAWTEEAARAYLGVARTVGRTADEADAPWRLGLTVIRQDRPGVRQILDIASGPGGFLHAALEQFPEAFGIWFDFSEAMRSQAMANFAERGDRVRYVLGDFSEVDRAAEQASIDLVLTARASHHLLVPDLEALYRSAFALLAPGGWFANLDIMTPPGDWDRRLREARAELRASEGRNFTQSHDHPNPMPSLEEHVGALQRAGFVESQEIWRSGVTAMVLARRPA